MPPFSPFYIHPQSAIRYVPRSTSEGVTHPESTVPRRSEIWPFGATTVIPQKGPDPKGAFFDDQHKKWREQEARMQQEAKGAWKPPIGTPGSNLARPKTLSDSVPLYLSGDAQPLTRTQSSRFPEPAPWPRMEDGTSFHPHDVLSQRLSPSPRSLKGHKSTYCDSAPVVHSLYGPPQTSSFYPYPVSCEMQTTNTKLSQTPPIANGMATSPLKYPRRPPPLNLHSRQQSSHPITACTTTTFSSAKARTVLSRSSILKKPNSESCEYKNNRRKEGQATDNNF